jgi:hypothetical protein
MLYDAGCCKVPGRRSNHAGCAPTRKKILMQKLFITEAPVHWLGVRAPGARALVLVK